jgi:peptide/nickel transport system permease protein
MSGRYGFVLRRLLSLAPLLLGILLLAMLLLSLAPGDPARQVAGPRAPQAEVAAVDRALARRRPRRQRYLPEHREVVTRENGTT